MQYWEEGVKEKTLLNLLIKKGIITQEEYDEELKKVKRIAWEENRYR